MTNLPFFNDPVSFLYDYDKLKVPDCNMAATLRVCKVSPVIGKGLFTTDHLLKGTWITNYGCQAFLPIGGKEYIGRADISDKDRQQLTEIVKTHAMDVKHPFVERIAAGNIENPLYLAHMANDGPGPELLHAMDLDGNISNAHLKYLQRIPLTCNAKMVRHNNGTATLQAAKDIPPNTEIRWAYGLDYWANDKWFEMISPDNLEKKMIPAVNTPFYDVFTKCVASFHLDTFLQHDRPCDCTICQ